MTTRIFQQSELAQAAELLRQGELVAFPTETVYGLGAIATNEAAVANVFVAKGRPSDNPLIVHVHSIEQVLQYVETVTPLAVALMTHFWPGPLTIILPVKQGVFPHNVNAGQPTIAFRMPNQAATLALIALVGAPLVGPSANLSGKPSPTQVAHVLHDFDGRIAGVVAGDTAQAQVGVESTVVRPHETHVTILRPGAITRSMLQAVCPQTEELSAQSQLEQPELMSPGVKYTHYSPVQPVYVMRPRYSQVEWQTLLAALPYTIGVLADTQHLAWCESLSHVVSCYSLGEPDDFASATRELYAGLRYLEQSGCEVIVVQGFEEQEATHALLNRLNKAAERTI